ncbi:hypothetical protein [Arenicella xantha]|uniref:Sulfotransferase family protein n=1 Tax=Arenicella xantha TaxID=644221 RepID=A0A395JN30_9GAMM|nr:hypothetical protein [Arenicella xantha]RBP52959.1 hypothetical protein DFR28_101343 [Arenicella xantha]
MSNKKNHVVVTGTGRAGTTFLIELFTHFGLDTGFTPDTLVDNSYQHANAGLEYQIGSDFCPYIAKDPSFCDYAEEIFAREDLFIEHIFIPIRDINSVAASRRHNEKEHIKRMSFKEKLCFITKPYLIPGGLLGTHSHTKGVQEAILIEKLFGLLLQVSQYHIPVTFIQFPYMMSHPEYLYQKLSPIVSHIPLADFIAIFRKIAQENLIHTY